MTIQASGKSPFPTMYRMSSWQDGNPSRMNPVFEYFSSRQNGADKGFQIDGKKSLANQKSALYTSVWKPN